MRTKFARFAFCLLAFWVHCNDAVAAPQTGWWWNPAESGRGFFIESDGERTFIGAYLYEGDGRAKWLVSGAPNTDAYNYTGELYSMSSGQTLFGAYVMPVGPNVAGTITVHFTDDTHGVITWPGGTMPIERFVFGGTERPAFEPIPGWWWDENESGSGYGIELQGDKLVFVGYMYDDAGRPVWYLSAGAMASERHYRGPLLAFAGGQAMGAPYRPPGTALQVGFVDVAFTANNEADLTFTNESPVFAKSTLSPGLTTAQKRSAKIKRTFNKAPRYYESQVVITDTIVLGPQTNVIRYSGVITWGNEYSSSTFPTVVYRRVWPTIIAVNFSSTLSVPGVDCNGNGSAPSDLSWLSGSEIVQYDVSTWDYQLTLALQGSVTVTTRCTASGVTVTTSEPVHVGLDLNQVGKVDGKVVGLSKVQYGFEADVSKTVVPGWTRTGTVTFVPRWN